MQNQRISRSRSLIVGVLLGAVLGMQTMPSALADTGYQPLRGQPGKDVIWIATPDAHVQRMLRLAGATPSDRLLDLGSGDGKIVLAAAQQGLRAHGVEYNPDLVTLSQRLAQQQGLQQRASFEKADLFDVDLRPYSIITMYLLPELNLRLRHKLLALEPGTRVVSHDFKMGKWLPDESSTQGPTWVHLWVIPANVGGQWSLQQSPADLAGMELDIAQHFQQLQGVARWGGLQTTLSHTQLRGRSVHFAFTDPSGMVRHFQGAVRGNSLEGELRSATDSQAVRWLRRGDTPAIQGAGVVPPEEMEYLF